MTAKMKNASSCIVGKFYSIISLGSVLFSIITSLAENVSATTINKHTITKISTTSQSIGEDLPFVTTATTTTRRQSSKSNVPSNKSTLSLLEPSSFKTSSISSILNPTTDFFSIIDNRDEYNRRYFPHSPIRPEGSFPYQPVPDCSSPNGRVGCVAIPSSIKAPPPPWAGTLYAKPPSCSSSSSSSSKECVLGIPMSIRSSHSFGDELISADNNNFDTDKPLIPLPGGTNDTYSIAVADVNNDGMLDLIIGNSRSSNHLLMNAGDGTFAENVIDLPGGVLDTTSTAVADFNNDGLLDIVVGNFLHTNQLLINDGDGAFNDVIDLPSGVLVTTSVAIADMNNDGLLDIVIGNYGDSNQLLFNTGDGTFNNLVDLPGGTLETSSVAVADVNNDGFVDIVLGNYNGNNQLLMNSSSGGGSFDFENVVDLPGGALRTSSIAIADIDGDGMVDIIVGNVAQKNQLLMNVGDGTFNKDTTTDLPGNNLETLSIASGDINNDGKLDIVVGNSFDSLNQILLNAGDGSFGDDFIYFDALQHFSEAMVIADVNNDGLADIIVGITNRANRLLMNTIEDTTYENIINLPNGLSSTTSIAIGDINNDGMLDIVSGHAGQKNQLFLNAGDGTFDEEISLDGGVLPNGAVIKTTSIVIADLNNDGMLDIVVGTNSVKKNNHWLLNTGDGSFDVIDLPGDDLSKTTSMAIGDVNNDGFVDIVIGNSEGGNQLLINAGDITFANVINLPGGNSSTTSIAIGDVNNDGIVDIVVGNDLQINQVLMNTGNGDFDNAIDLPGGVSKTRSIAIGDVDNDGLLDIVVGNFQQSNHVLINGDDGSFNVIDLPGDDLSKTTSMAIGDVNNDGFVDIIVGNYGQNSEFLVNNNAVSGGDMFLKENLPGGDANTMSVAVGDMNNNGMLDIILGVYNENNQLLPYSSCPKWGAARLHSKSWCFQCPSFMGAVNSICRECMPDFQQNPGINEQQSCATELKDACPLGYQRELGEEDLCSRCPDGTYYDTTISRSASDPSTWIAPRCIPCSPGEYSTQDINTIDTCIDCKPGTYQPDEGASSCFHCEIGEFQPDFGKNYCKSCAVGGYCDASNKVAGGFTPCRAGTYNDKVGQIDETACKLCPAGTYSPTSGGKSIDVCLECPPGTYSDQPGQTKCQQCSPGTFQKNHRQTSCDACPSGTYADKSGFEECIKCPYRLGSTNRSSLCSFCASEFYLNDILADSTEISLDPFKYCLPCPSNAVCGQNTTLYDLDVRPTYWRHSRNTSRLYHCGRSTSCIGTHSEDTNKRYGHSRSVLANSLLLSEETSIYCEEGHTGPLCEVCIDNDDYFSITDGKCTKCPSSASVVLRFAGILFCIILFTALAIYLQQRKQIPSSILIVVLSLSIQAKIKLLVSFYQVLSSLENVYGVTVSSELTRWMDIFQNLSLDFLQITGMPISCIGSTKQQLMINASWPFMVIAVGVICIVIHYWMMQNRKIGWCRDGKILDLLKEYQSMYGSKKRIIQLIIIVLYFALPVVSQRIFDAIKCRAFQTNDDIPPAFQSHLLMDMSIICNTQEDNDYGSILGIFWTLFTLWIILIPLAFVVLLKYIGPSVQSKSITFLTDACRFLWQDYDASMWFWDIMDTYRKIFLTGAIILIDTEEGSNKMLRLVVAIIVSMLYICILLAYRPYKRSDDHNLAFLSNFLMICCFVLSMILKLCTDDDDQNDDGDGNNVSTCNQLIGLSLDSYKASILVVALSLGMLLITVCFIIVLAINKITAPTVRMTSTGYAPNLELPEHCNFHIFMSHVWGTGQAKTHAITRKLQLFLPGLKVWLDVDELQDISKLEESVAESAVFILYYSKGYFKSKNCRREIYAAIKLEKPIILLYEGNDSFLEEMKVECMNNCGGNNSEQDCPRAGLILEKLLGDTNILHADSRLYGPIQWLNEGSFSAAAMNRICSRILINFPHYKRYPSLLLEQGIKVPDELGPVSLESPINILVYENNFGCSDLAQELKSILSHEDSASVCIHDARMILKTNTETPATSRDYDDVANNQLNIVDDQSILPNLGSMSTFFLLYLNEHTFQGHDQNELTAIIQSCIDDSEISIVLVHERDIAKGGCDFGDFFVNTPQELFKPPNNLFKDIAIPLYSTEEYRTISLRQILCKMGATVKSGNSSMMSIMMRSIKTLLLTVRSRGGDHINQH